MEKIDSKQEFLNELFKEQDYEELKEVYDANGGGAFLYGRFQAEYL